jgi:hypothetical protein
VLFFPESPSFLFLEYSQSTFCSSYSASIECPSRPFITSSSFTISISTTMLYSSQVTWAQSPPSHVLHEKFLPFLVFYYFVYLVTMLVHYFNIHYRVWPYRFLAKFLKLDLWYQKLTIQVFRQVSQTRALIPEDP